MSALDCGHEARPTYYKAGSRITCGSKTITMTGDEVMFPGFATLPDGRKVCPACADDTQREDMATARRFTAYLSADDRKVTTWTGGRLGDVLTLTRNRRQAFVRVRDTHGNMWAGIGPAESGTYVSLRRIKG